MQEGQNENRKETYVGRRYDTDPAVHRWLYSSKDILLEVEKYLRGQQYDPKLHEWVQVRKPIMSEDGINTTLLALNPYASKLFSMSHFEEGVIKQLVHSFNKDIIILIGTDMNDELGIDPKHKSVVVRMLGNIVYATLRKALKGLSLGVVKDTEETREVRTTDSQQGGFLGIFRRR